MQADLKTQYTKMVATGEMRQDKAQLVAIEKLEHIRRFLEQTSESRGARLAGLLGLRTPPPPPGLYLWGSVGTGKSMLMDLFFSATDIRRKRRVHFHAFMQEVHEAMYQVRQTEIDDPIAVVAAGIAAEARLLCFDEMQITDITDAMIIGRLFEQLLSAGSSIVTTSNRAPDDLYKDGLNRQLFLPFIDLIKQRLQVHHLLSAFDYRQDKLRGQQTWFSPTGKAADTEMARIWLDLAEHQGAPLTLHVKGRNVVLPCFHNGVARVGFADLCAKPLGPADYLAIADAVRVLLVDNIPRLSRARNNEAKRFITLIDTLYEAKTQLICSAEAEPEMLYVDGPGAFEFQRTASRLREMQSAEWGAETSVS